MSSKKINGKKTVLITGAGSGIGLAMVKKFLVENWRVLAHYHTSDSELKALQKKAANSLELLQSDFKNAVELNKFLGKLGSIFLDVLVNNAGDHDGSIDSKDRIADIQKTFLINTIAPALIAERVLVGMKARKKGSIVNISSIGAKYGSALNCMFYSATKRGLEAITKSLAREGAAHNILVNTVRPGLTNTPFLYRVRKNIDERKKMIPLKRLAEPAEIADFVFYLSANNSYITGEILTIAGGE